MDWYVQGVKMKTEQLIIRKATKKDIKAVREIANVPGLRAAGDDCAPPERWYVPLLKENFYIAEDDGKVVGFLTGEKIRNIGLLWEIGVLPEFRSRGIGSLLLNKFRKECDNKKLVVMIAYGHVDKKTLDFFRKHKFIEGDTYKELRLNLKHF
jgi:N-acetylglutamate synthase-like GNAT family acetyltransferase